MVNEEMTLTFSVRNNPGVYALLLGSGVSSEAGVPTGWGIVEDVIMKIADTEYGEDPDDAFEWYKDKTGDQPEYDSLIEDVAPSREERQSILEKYFEPTDEQRQEGIKTPSTAHRNIAWLIDEGYINLVITTNFDQLLEQALSERGINPVVISSESDADGAAPLAQQDEVILKVNGDYTKTNIRNVTEELDGYDPALSALLDQIFDEYGLIVCGWSGEWDIALREALLSCESRRYSTFWAYHGELEEQAKKIIAQRDAIGFQITGASDFFYGLKERVQGLEGAESGAPITRDVARERVKRYMMREDRRIDLADLLREEQEEAYSDLYDEDLYPLDTDFNDDSLDERLKKYENLIGKLAVATSTCAYWGPESENSATKQLSELVDRLGSANSPDGTFQKVWRDLRMYPSSYLMYGMGVAAVDAENWELVSELLWETEIDAAGFPNQRAGSVLNPWTVGARIGRRGGGNGKLRTRMMDSLRDDLREFIPDEERYTERFHMFEALADMVVFDKLEEDSRIEGTRFMGALYWEETLEEIEEKLGSDEQWGPVEVGMFDGSPMRAKLLHAALKEKSRV